MSFVFLSRLFDLLVPPRAYEGAVRKLTYERLLRMRGAAGLPYADKTVSALVWELKYYANARAAALAGAVLTEELVAIAAEELGVPLLIPVPMHPDRRRERGHNQTELLCEAALQALEDVSVKKSSDAFEYAPKALERVKPTPEQQKLDRAKRLINVTGSMRANPALVKGRVCVVVDDVKTTGATLNEATRALKKAGALRVHTVALAYS